MIDTLLTRQERWEASVGNSDWTDEDVWEAIAKAQEAKTKRLMVEWLEKHNWGFGERDIEIVRP